MDPIAQQIINNFIDNNNYNVEILIDEYWNFKKAIISIFQYVQEISFEQFERILPKSVYVVGYGTFNAKSFDQLLEQIALSCMLYEKIPITYTKPIICSVNYSHQLYIDERVIYCKLAKKAFPNMVMAEISIDTDIENYTEIARNNKFKLVCRNPDEFAFGKTIEEYKEILRNKYSICQIKPTKPINIEALFSKNIRNNTVKELVVKFDENWEFKYSFMKVNKTRLPITLAEFDIINCAKYIELGKYSSLLTTSIQEFLYKKATMGSPHLSIPKTYRGFIICECIRYGDERIIGSTSNCYIDLDQFPNLILIINQKTKTDNFRQISQSVWIHNSFYDEFVDMVGTNQNKTDYLNYLKVLFPYTKNFGKKIKSSTY